MNAGNRLSCRELFKKLNILPLHSQYILSLLLFVVKNMYEFIANSKVYTINTWHRSDLHPLSINLTIYQKEFITQGLKFLITYLKISRTYLGMWKKLN